MPSESTNPIAADTRNLSVNVLDRQFDLLGRAAFEEGVSKSDFLRGVIRLGLAAKDKALALRWDEAKRQRFCQGANLVILGSLITFQSFTLDFDDYRRAWKPKPAARAIRRNQ